MMWRDRLLEPPSDSISSGDPLLPLCPTNHDKGQGVLRLSIRMLPRLDPIHVSLPGRRQRSPLGSKLGSYLLACRTISKSADSLVDVSPQSYTYIILAAVGVHAIYLTYTMITTFTLRMNLEIQKTVVILGSQKTLPVAMSILTFFPDSIGEKVSRLSV